MHKEKMTSRFMLTVEPSLLERVDSWRIKQAGIPSRAEAMRRFIRAGLEGDGE